MTYRRSPLVPCWTAAAVLITGASAAGQQLPPPQPNRPAQGIFQGDQTDPQVSEAVHLNASFWEAYDQNVIGGSQAGAGLDPRFRASGFYSRGDARLFYLRKTPRVEFASSGGASLDYYPNLDNYKQGAYWGSLGLVVPTRRVTVRVMQDATYSPYFVLGSFPALAAADSTSVAVNGFALFALPVATYNSAARVGRKIGRRSSVDASYDLNIMNFGPEWTDLLNQTVGSRLNVSLGRLTGLHGGYAYRLGSYEVLPTGDATTRGHDVDAGFDYARPLSPTRTIGFSGGAGASVFDTTIAPLNDKKSYARSLAYATFGYDFGRTWGTRAEFRRSLQFIPGVTEPFFGNGFSATLAGNLSRRADVLVAGQYSQGELGVGLDSKGYDARQIMTRFRYALSRQVAVSTDYNYYSYDFSRVADLPGDVPRVLGRHAIRVGLTFGTLLLQRRSKP